MANHRTRPLRQLLDVSKALSDEGRVRMLGALRGGELCVCQLVELLELAPSTVSKHLGQLRQSGLIESRKRGRWVYYRLADDDAPPFVRGALGLLAETWAEDPAADQDAKRLAEILAIDPEVLCCRQRESPVAARRGRGGSSSGQPTEDVP